MAKAEKNIKMTQAEKKLKNILVLKVVTMDNQQVSSFKMEKLQRLRLSTLQINIWVKV